MLCHIMLMIWSIFTARQRSLVAVEIQVDYYIVEQVGAQALCPCNSKRIVYCVL